MTETLTRDVLSPIEPAKPPAITLLVLADPPRIEVKRERKRRPAPGRTQKSLELHLSPADTLRLARDLLRALDAQVDFRVFDCG